MKNQVLILLAAWLMLAQPVNAQLIGPGEIFELSFSDLPYAESLPDASGRIDVTFTFVSRYTVDAGGNVSSVPNGFFNLDLFENVDHGAPFTSSRDEPVPLGFTFSYANLFPWMPPVPWSDRDGRLRIWATEGDFDLLSIDISVVTDGMRYQQSFAGTALTAVPLPAAAWFFASGLVAMFRGARFKKPV